MQTIIVGTDGSDTAAIAAKDAAELARKLDAELHLVTVLRKTSTTVVRGGGESWQISGLDRAEAMLAATKGTLGGGRIVCNVLDGDPAKALVAEAERIGADIIVVGNKRTHGPARVLGAIANDIVAHAPCGVLICKTT